MASGVRRSGPHGSSCLTRTSVRRMNRWTTRGRCRRAPPPSCSPTLRAPPGSGSRLLGQCMSCSPTRTSAPPRDPSVRGYQRQERGEGDSVFAVFSRATDAVIAASALQQALPAETRLHDPLLQVRTALHTGGASVHDGDHLGATINRAFHSIDFREEADRWTCW
jgi:hypothetical protein